jgi:hypothetical protein
MDAIDNQEITDYLLTVDFLDTTTWLTYRPETWSPSTFFSEDVEIEFPQDGMLESTFPISFRHYG